MRRILAPDLLKVVGLPKVSFLMRPPVAVPSPAVTVQPQALDWSKILAAAVAAPKPVPAAPTLLLQPRPLPEGPPPSDLYKAITPRPGEPVEPLGPAPMGLPGAGQLAMLSQLVQTFTEVKEYEGYPYRILKPEAAQQALFPLDQMDVSKSAYPDSQGTEWVLATATMPAMPTDMPTSLGRPGGGAEWVVLALATGYGVMMAPMNVGGQAGVGLAAIDDVSVASEYTMAEDAQTVVLVEPKDGWKVPGKPTTEPTDPGQQQLAKEILAKAGVDEVPKLGTGAIIALAVLGVVVVGGVTYVVLRKK
jgi:hypothetical protein